MKKFLILALLVAGFCGCNSEEESKPLVTDVSILPNPRDPQNPHEPFVPGEEVTVTGSGFTQGDQILIRRGAVILDADVTLIQSDRIGFIVPTGLPGGESEVILMRGDKFQVLGMIKTYDGKAPENYSLYGIAHASNGRTIISQIDLKTGELNDVIYLDAPLNLENAVNVPGTNRIYGVKVASGKRMPAYFDLTSRKYYSGTAEILTTGSVGANVAAYLEINGGGLLQLGNTWTRAFNNQRVWEMPSGITADMLTENTFVGPQNIMLAAKTAENYYKPVVLEIGGAYRTLTGTGIPANNVFPFQMMYSFAATPVLAGGYASVQNASTTFQLFDPSAVTPLTTIGEVPAVVLSCATMVENAETKVLYLLCRTDEGMRVYTYTIPTESSAGVLTPLTGVVRLSEILFAR